MVTNSLFIYNVLTLVQSDIRRVLSDFEHSLIGFEDAIYDCIVLIIMMEYSDLLFFEKKSLINYDTYESIELKYTNTSDHINLVYLYKNYIRRIVHLTNKGNRFHYINTGFAKTYGVNISILQYIQQKIASVINYFNISVLPLLGWTFKIKSNIGLINKAIQDKILKLMFYNKSFQFGLVINSTKILLVRILPLLPSFIKKKIQFFFVTKIADESNFQLFDEFGLILFFDKYENEQLHGVSKYYDPFIDPIHWLYKVIGREKYLKENN